MIGTDTAKDLLFQRLQIDDPGPGYWHFPISDDFDRTFFQQLVAEERITKFVQGQRREVWVDPGRAHEAWDCGVYGLAACRIAVQNMGARLDVKAVGGRKKKGKLEVRKATKIEDKYL